MEVTVELTDEEAASFQANEPRTLCGLGAGLLVIGKVKDALPKPIKVGDRVRRVREDPRQWSGTVIGRDLDIAWVRWDGSAGRGEVAISDLVNVY
jgi:hypothetical protein